MAGDVSSHRRAAGTFIIIFAGLVPVTYLIEKALLGTATFNTYRNVFRALGVASIGYLLCRPGVLKRVSLVLWKPALCASGAIIVLSLVFFLTGIRMIDIADYRWFWSGPFSYAVLSLAVLLVLGASDVSVPWAIILTTSAGWLYELPIATVAYSSADWLFSFDIWPIFPFVVNSSLICSIAVFFMVARYAHTREVLTGIVLWLSSIPLHVACLAVGNVRSVVYFLRWWQRVPVIIMLILLTVAIRRADGLSNLVTVKTFK